jgi:hypothetical protein
VRISVKGGHPALTLSLTWQGNWAKFLAVVEGETVRAYAFQRRHVSRVPDPHAMFPSRGEVMDRDASQAIL